MVKLRLAAASLVFWRTAMADHFLHGIELVEIEDGDVYIDPNVTKDSEQ